MTLTIKGLLMTLSVHDTWYQRHSVYKSQPLCWVSRFICCHAECHSAECSYADCHGTICKTHCFRKPKMSMASTCFSISLFESWRPLERRLIKLVRRAHNHFFNNFMRHLLLFTIYASKIRFTSHVIIFPCHFLQLQGHI